MNKVLIKQLLSRIGISLKKSSNQKPINLIDEINLSPIEAKYSYPGRDILLEVPLDACITFNSIAFGCGSSSKSPFVNTLKQFKENRSLTYKESKLKKYYDSYKPSSACEVFGLTNPYYQRLNILSAAAAMTRPWLNFDLELQGDIRANQINVENRMHGSKLKSENGDQFYGPVTDAKGELEFSRLVSIFNAIEKNGFKYDEEGFDNVTVVCLYNEDRDSFRYMVSTGGQHRLSALAALGYSSVVVQLGNEGLGGVVRSSDIPHWPAVKKGYFTVAEAQLIFDRIFNCR